MNMLLPLSYLQQEHMQNYVLEEVQHMMPQLFLMVIQVLESILVFLDQIFLLFWKIFREMCFHQL